MKKYRVEKLCCGSSALILEADFPISKDHVEKIKKHDFEFPPQYLNAGIFYAQKRTFIATTAYGTKVFQVRYSQKDEKVLEEFEILIDSLKEK